VALKTWFKKHQDYLQHSEAKAALAWKWFNHTQPRIGVANIILHTIATRAVNKLAMAGW